MSWNYRLTVHSLEDSELWEVRELYYTNGMVTKWSFDPVMISYESHPECTESLQRMLEASKKPAWDLDAKCWVDKDRQPVEEK